MEFILIIKISSFDNFNEFFSILEGWFSVKISPRSSPGPISGLLIESLEINQEFYHYYQKILKYMNSVQLILYNFKEKYTY